MIEIKTAQGNSYYYSAQSNKIYPIEMSDEDCSEFHYILSDLYSSSKISMFTIEVTQQCNLRCKYCCYSGKYEDRRSHNSMQMSWDTLNSCGDFIERNMNQDELPVVVSFYGGEALLAKDKISWAINELQKRHPQVIFEFSISTNGLLLNKKTIEWICSLKNLKVTVTIDGNKEMHDVNRVTVDGDGTFDQIKKNLQMFYQLMPDEYMNRIQYISTVESISNVIYLNDFWINDPLLKLTRPKHISSIIPNFKKGERVSASKEVFENFYRSAFNAYVNGEENILTDELKRLVNIVGNRRISQEPEQQRFRTCLNDLYSCFITADGFLFACERFCKGYNIGSLKEGVIELRCRQLNESFLHRKNKYCKSCWARRICRICATNLQNTEDQFLQYCESERMQIELALQYYCELLEFKHIKTNNYE